MSDIFDPSEKYQSQVPALQLLVNMGFKPLSQSDADLRRGGRQRNVLLENVLLEQVLKINHFTVRGQSHNFDIADAQEALRRLKPSPDKLKGLRSTNQDIYDLLVLGTTISKSIDGDSKSHSFRYVDWDTPENNAYHVTAEFSVERTGSTQTRRCDIVAFVNGIPFAIIENKGPLVNLKKADSQLIGYQNEENIPYLFHYAQMLMTMNRASAKYATVGTSIKFWSTWRDEEDKDEDIHRLVNTSLTQDQKNSLFSGDFAAARRYFEDMEAQGERAVTEQDRTVYALCRPERLLDIVRRFTVFDRGERKITRHQQFFGIRSAMEKVHQFDTEGRRRGGVVWHTQGSGKSLTMVMLGRALALDHGIKNPRLVLVTDRVDLARQIKDTFKSCDMTPEPAKSGPHLLDLLEQKKPLITTVINKFSTALQARAFVDEDPSIFVLIDESHRSQTGKYGGHGNFAARMRKVLPKACYIGFTGTPLLKKEKNDLKHFGGLIHKYTIDEAVADEAVVPLLYEGRMVEQKITGPVIDEWFEKISKGLTDEQKADLKRKFSQISKVSSTSQALEAKAFDISEHFRQYWQGTGFKAQIVAPSKAAAIRMKDMLDDIGHVTSEIIISPPDDHEGNEDIDAPSKDLVRKFWDRIIEKYKTEEDYNREVIEAFKEHDDPEILIVVSKLLTGFDAPCNTVLYICKPLREHNLLQAIARVNRLFENEEGEPKQFGFIIDYEGLLGELDKALTTYSTFQGYDENDLAGTIHDVREEIRKLPQLHDQLWDLFKEIANKRDMEAFEQFLADKAKREEFYEQLKVYGRCLHVALSSDKALDIFTEDQIGQFKADLKQFTILKRRVQIRYQEIVDVKEFEPKIQKLLDDHVIAMPAHVIIEAVNINDPEALERVVSEQGISSASKADRIASATKRTISEKMGEDPVFYKRFSELLEQTISDYRVHRMSEMDYLKKIMDIAQNVAGKKRGRTLPGTIQGNDDAAAFFEVLEPYIKKVSNDNLEDQTAEIALKIIQIVKDLHITNVWTNDVRQNEIRNAIDDYFFDVVRDEKGIGIPIDVLDTLETEIMALARRRFPG